MKRTKRLSRVLITIGIMLSIYGILLIMRNIHLSRNISMSSGNGIPNPITGLQHFLCAISIIGIGYITYQKTTSQELKKESNRDKLR